MEPETLAGLFGFGGALVGAAVSTGAVIWQQRRTARETERTYLLGLSEAAANGVIQITYRMEDHYAGGVPRRETPEGSEWHADLKVLLRDLENEALRFPDSKTRRLVQWGNAEILRDPEGVAVQEGWEAPRYGSICIDFRTVMGTVLRREPFPDGIWAQFPGAWPPS